MQKSLTDYINKIHHSTETLTKQNEELVKASELAREDDRMKTAVINNMTDQMLNPINAIAEENELIRREYKSLSEDEMAQHVDRMLENTETVTRLLNQILDASDVSAASEGLRNPDGSGMTSESTPLSNEDPTTT